MAVISILVLALLEVKMFSGCSSLKAVVGSHLNYESLILYAYSRQRVESEFCYVCDEKYSCQKRCSPGHVLACIMQNSGFVLHFLITWAIILFLCSKGNWNYKIYGSMTMEWRLCSVFLLFILFKKQQSFCNFSEMSRGHNLDNISLLFFPSPMKYETGYLSNIIVRISFSYYRFGFLLWFCFSRWSVAAPVFCILQTLSYERNSLIFDQSAQLILSYLAYPPRIPL